MNTPDLQARLQIVRSQYLVTPWIPPRDDEAPLLRSWQRSRDAGLRESDRIEFELVSRSLLSELDDRHGALVRAARPETERLAASLRGTGATVLLINPRGTVIDRLCDETSLHPVLRNVTRVGIDVSERCVGTTAPSIALAEGLPYLVGRDAHFCTSTRAFFCVAAPIDSPRGERLGALDITTYDSVPAFDILSLAIDAAASIENGLFEAGPEQLLVRFHPRGELVGTPLEGLLQVDGDGIVTGANRAAARLLCCERAQLIGRPGRELLDRDPARLFGAPPSARRGDLVLLQTHAGLQVQARFEGAGRRERPASVASSVAPVASVPSAAAVAAPAPLPSPPPPHAARLRDIERESIDAALAAHGGNVTAAARQLGISRNTIYRKRSAPAG